MTAAALTIAGSDPSGGAGLQADLKTFHQHGVYGMSAVTLLTVQNTRSVSGIEFISPDFIQQQIAAVVDDIPPQAAKTGALGSRDAIERVASCAAAFSFPLVVDPVMISKHGHALIEGDAVEALKTRLAPLAFLMTPNVFEAEALTGVKIASQENMVEAGRRIKDFGCRNVIIKGGAQQTLGIDLLLTESGVHEFATERVETRNLHGSGCVFSAALTAQLARGESIETAAELAKAFIDRAIRSAPSLGGGCGPVNMSASSD